VKSRCGCVEFMLEFGVYERVSDDIVEMDRTAVAVESVPANLRKIN